MPAGQALLLGGKGLLLASKVDGLLLELLDPQFHRLALGGDVGLGRHHLAGNVLQPSGGVLADPREAFLCGDQLHLQHRDLLIAPPAQGAEADQQRQHHDPQRRRARLATAGRAALLPRTGVVGVIARALANRLQIRRRVGLHTVTACGQAGDVVQFVVSIVAHGLPSMARCEKQRAV